MMTFLENLDADLILGSRSTSTSGKKKVQLEAFWSREFYRIGFQLLDRNTTIYSEVQELKDVSIAGKIDYTIKNGIRTWMVEFLISGDEAGAGEEHYKRFQTTYKKFAKYPFLVVDFRKTIKKISESYKGRSELINYWIMYYYCDESEVQLTVLTNNNFQQFTLFSKNIKDMQSEAQILDDKSNELKRKDEQPERKKN